MAQLHPGRLSRAEASVLLFLVASPFWLPAVLLVTDWLGLTHVLAAPAHEARAVLERVEAK